MGNLRKNIMIFNFLICIISLVNLEISLEMNWNWYKFFVFVANFIVSMFYINILTRQK